MAKPIEEMSGDEFMSAWTALAQQVEQDKLKLKEFSQEHQRRTRYKQLRLEPGDLALLQSSAPAGIESEEQVNG